MKSFITALLLIGTIVIAKAQNNYNNNNSNAYNTSNNSYHSNTSYNSSNNSYGNNYSYSSYNGNANGWASNNNYTYWTIRKITKSYLFETGMFLNNVLCQFTPSPFTGPLLSDAVRHQRFAKTLYHQGFYDEALQHSNYARSLTMKAVNFLNPYFMPGFTDFSFLDEGYGNNNPAYGANNDDYRKSNPNGSTNASTGNRKANHANNSIGVKQIMKKEISSSEIETLEQRLPKDNIQEKELLKTKSQDLTIE